MDELKDKTEITLEVKDIKPVLNPSNDIRGITGLFKTVSTAPTKTPRTVFEQIQVYRNGATLRLYIYDSTNNAWRYATLT